jgi:hypothetical protein
LVVENMGPIRFAELELPCVTIVTGGNGSGKTTLAMIHYLTLFQQTPEVAKEDVVTLEVGEGYVEVDLREHLDVVCGYVKELIRRLFQTEPGRLISQGEASAAIRVEAGGVRLEVALERGGSVACDLSGATARRFEVKVVETDPWAYFSEMEEEQGRGGWEGEGSRGCARRRLCGVEAGSLGRGGSPPRF